MLGYVTSFANIRLEVKINLCLATNSFCHPEIPQSRSWSGPHSDTEGTRKIDKFRKSPTKAKAKWNYSLTCLVMLITTKRFSCKEIRKSYPILKYASLMEKRQRLRITIVFVFKTVKV